MDVTALDLVLFVASTFLAALVAGLAGFAFGLVAAGVWLHVLTPVQTAILIIAFGLIVQGVAVWKLRHALQWVRLWPFLLGGAFGVPIAVMVLSWIDPRTMRLAIGAVSDPTAPMRGSPGDASRQARRNHGRCRGGRV